MSLKRFWIVCFEESINFDIMGMNCRTADENYIKMEVDRLFDKRRFS